MQSNPKTIQIFLPSGDPRGIRSAEITTRIVQVIEIPRSKIADFFKMPESKQVAVYILFGESEDDSTPLVYIGQSSSLQARIAAHNVEKDFWQRAVVVISKTNSLTQTHVLFLEWFFIQEAKKISRYATDVNKNNGSKPYTPQYLEADCFEIYETARVLLSTLGYPIFEPIVKEDQNHHDIFYCKRAGDNMTGEYTEEGFVILKGSVGRTEIKQAFLNHSFKKLRDDLINQGKIGIVNNELLFKEDVLFSTPSGAAAVACGASANGWKEWKTKDGVSLHQAKRENLQAKSNDS